MSCLISGDHFMISFPRSCPAAAAAAANVKVFLPLPKPIIEARGHRRRRVNRESIALSLTCNLFAFSLLRLFHLQDSHLTQFESHCVDKGEHVNDLSPLYLLLCQANDDCTRCVCSAVLDPGLCYAVVVLRNAAD